MLPCRGCHTHAEVMNLCQRNNPHVASPWLKLSLVNIGADKKKLKQTHVECSFFGLYMEHLRFIMLDGSSLSVRLISFGCLDSFVEKLQYTNLEVQKI